MALSTTDRGVNTHNTSSTSIVVTPGSNFAAGSLAVLCVSYDNSATGGADPYSSIADSVGNTWTSRAASLNDPGAANAGNATRIFTSDMSVATLTTSNTITVTLSTSTTAKAWALFQVTPDSGYTAVFVAGGQASQSTATPSITTGSITNGGVVIGVVGREGNGTRTGDADTTNGSWSTAQQTGVGTTTGGSEIIAQSKVVTATATQTYNPTFSGVTGDGNNLWVWFTQNKNIAIGSGAATTAGISVDDILGTVCAPSGAVVTLVTGAVTIDTPSPVVLVIASGAITVATSSAAAVQGRIFAAGSSAILFGGYAPACLTNSVEQPATGAATITGPPPTAFPSGNVYYVIYTGNLGAPSATQVKNGQDATGAAALFSGVSIGPLVDAVPFSFGTQSGLDSAEPLEVAYVWSNGLVDSNVVACEFSPAIGTGAVTLTGVAPTVSVSGGATNTTFTPGAGAIACTGGSVVIVRGSILAGNAGAVVLSGVAPIGLRGEIKQPGAGAVTLTGVQPSPSTGSVVAVGSGSVATTGQAPLLRLALPTQSGSATFSGQAVAGLSGENKQPASGAVLTSGAAPLLDLRLLTTPGAIGVSGVAPTVIVSSAGNTTFAPASSSIAISGAQPSASTNSILGVGSGGVATAGTAPLLQFALPTQPGSVVLVGQSTVGLRGEVKQTPSAAVLVSGAAPILGLLLPVPSGAISVSGVAPTAIVSSASNTTFAPASGAITVSGSAGPLVAVGQPIATGAMALVGQPVSAVAGTLLQVGSGAITLAGSAPVGVRGSMASPATGAINVSGTQPVAVTSVVAAVPSGSVAFVGSVPLLLANSLVPSGAVALSGVAPVAIVTSASNTTINVPAGAIQVAGELPTPVIDFRRLPTTAVILAQGGQVALDTSIPVPSGSVVCAGAPVTILTPTSIDVPSGTISLTGRTVAAVADRLAAPGSGQISANGLPVVLSSGALASVPVGTLSIAGQPVTTNHAILVNSGSVTLVGYPPDPIVLASGGPSADQVWDYVLSNGMTAGETLDELAVLLRELYRIRGLELGSPLVVAQTSRTVADIVQSITELDGVVTVVRQ
jgi:hypothetical protein